MKMRRRAAEPAEPVSQRDAARERWGHLRKVAKEMKAFRPASAALTRVRAVPTIFPDFDLATKVGGLPTERFTLLHGPSAGGKTYLTLAMILSFILQGHPAHLIDAERTTPNTWVEKAFRGHLGDVPEGWGEMDDEERIGHEEVDPRWLIFTASRPESYEDVRAEVKQYCNKIADQRKKGLLPREATALIVVDSIRKLVPKDQLDTMLKLMKEMATGKLPIEQARSRMAQIKAQMNAAWVDELVPLLEKTGCAMIVIAREIMDPDNTNPKSIKAKTNVKTGGGGALFYDASLDLRVQYVGKYGKKASSDPDAKILPWGSRHRIDIMKTKVSGQGDDFRTSCFFHISNGSKCPEGFDTAMDLLELARRLGVVDGTRTLAYKNKRWRNDERALAALRDDPALFDQLEADVRKVFKLEKTRAA